MAEHRRSMQALGKVSRSAAGAASRTRHLHVVPGSGDEDPAVAIVPVDEPDDDGVDAPEATAAPAVVSIAAARARRVGHPAGSSRRS